MTPEEFPKEDAASFEIELTALLRNVSDGRRIRDLRVFLKSAKESMCLCLPITFEPQEESFTL